MPAPLARIETSAELPPKADAVVIGGGIVGTCAAYYLAQRGLSVVLLEKGRIGAEQSSRNWGWCRQQNRDARELPISTRSLDLWDRLQAAGIDTGFRRCGLLYLSNDEAEITGWARWRDFAKTQGVTTHMLTAAEATERGSASGKIWKGGVFSPTDGIADPSRAAPAIALGVEALGGRVIQMCAARGLELSGGRVSGVVTERGTIRTRVAIMAGGAWASSFMRQLGVGFPQASVRSSILAVAPGAELPDAVHTAQVSLTRRSDGGYTVAVSGAARVDVTPQQIRYWSKFLPMFFKRRKSLAPGGLEGLRGGHESLCRWTLDRETPMERMRILDPRPDMGQINLTLARARALFPELADVPMTAAWAGYIDSTPDGVPAIGESRVPGLILAAGFSGHGFGIGPGAGHLVADLVTDAAPIVDPEPYRPARLDHSVWGKVADF